MGKMRSKIRLALIVLALGTAPALAARLSGDSTAGDWYAATEDERAAWLEFVIAQSKLPSNTFLTRVGDCIQRSGVRALDERLGALSARCSIAIEAEARR